MKPFFAAPLSGLPSDPIAFGAHASRLHFAMKLVFAASMREAELFRILQPQAYGGFEYGFDVFAELVATIGRGYGSSAWVYGLGAVRHGRSSTFLRDSLRLS
jgi:hypothetical protein